MAFKTFTPATEPITLEQLGRSIVRRRQAADDPPIPRNPGTHRTPSKRALLKAIEEAGGEW